MKSHEKAQKAQKILKSHLCFLCLFAAFEAAAQTRVDYSRFSHSNQKHRLECQTCHKFPSENWKLVRKDDAFPDISEFPDHASCINCHRKQFFARERPAPRICQNCHVKATPNNTSRYPFPSLREAFLATARGATFVAEFRVRFPHDKHSDQECTDCHQSPESPKTKPLAHAMCFTCHNQESELAPSPQSCGACHKMGGETSLRLFAHAASQVTTTDYSKFEHDNKNHSRLPCLLCHRRENNSAQPTLPGKDQHTPCIGCHAPLFANNSGPICTICHTEAGAKTVKSFPPLRSFGSRFDHALHATAKCGSCHRPTNRGVALAIPTGTNAHNTCFSCHQPQAKANGRDISSCGVCHRPEPLVRASIRAVAFRRGFSHAHHDDSLRCSDCHKALAGNPRKDVTAPIPLNHHAPARGFSCMSCHNGKRAFGGDDFAACTRCHKGSRWRF